MSTYLDCNATTPLDPKVRDVVLRYLCDEYGNAGSRTHEFGNRAKQAVQRAREQVASVVKARPEEVIWTSGATESNNLALLGLAEWLAQNGKRHIVSSAIEHKAVLEPLEELSRRGFEVTLLSPGTAGYIEPAQVRAALRQDTGIVSLMHVNNETGVIQPIEEVAGALDGHPAFFHVDAAQGFGKDIGPLRSSRIDFISVSGHKLYAPKGVGALIARRRNFRSPPLRPLVFGGGQERGLRPGTLPVHLIAGLGEASELALAEHQQRLHACECFRTRLLEAFKPLGYQINGAPERLLPSTLNLSIPGVNSESAMVVLKGLIAISNGSACTSQSYEPSHVLTAMGLSETCTREAIRISWCHLTEQVDWSPVVKALESLR